MAQRPIIVLDVNETCSTSRQSSPPSERIFGHLAAMRLRGGAASRAVENDAIHLRRLDTLADANAVCEVAQSAPRRFGLARSRQGRNIEPTDTRLDFTRSASTSRAQRTTTSELAPRCLAADDHRCHRTGDGIAQTGHRALDARQPRCWDDDDVAGTCRHSRQRPTRVRSAVDHGMSKVDRLLRRVGVLCRTGRRAKVPLEARSASLKGLPPRGAKETRWLLTTATSPW
jgi:hypothetical protein